MELVCHPERNEGSVLKETGTKILRRALAEPSDEILRCSQNDRGRNWNGMRLVVILSGTKDLFQGEGEILYGACPELNDETLRFTQGDKARGSG